MERTRDGRLWALAAKQYGAFSRAQATGLGFSETEIHTRLSNGTWIQLAKAVYAIAGSADTWHRRAMAAALAAGEGAAVSEAAAAYLLGLIDHAPARITTVVPYPRRRQGSRRSKNLTRSDIKLHGEIPATCVFRTIVDLAGTMVRERFEDVLDRALVRGLITIDSERRYIRSRGLAHQRGASMLNELLVDRERGVPEGELEREFERLVARFGIRTADRQFEVGDRRIDFVYHDEKVVIEVDGRRDRSTRQRFDDDRARRNEISLAMPDYLPLQFTWGHLKERPEWVADTMRRALERPR